ncbi:MAG: NUDIX domain-containing protein [Verrucomicrobia bacterium]|nr:NUDIX domain-containing protein [Verrucomicrobiota bacterium]
MKRTGTTSVNAYLILRKEDQILFLLRKNTGYFDGYYGLVSGHVEEGESGTVGMIREASEEAGIIPLELKPVYVLHRYSDRYNIDLFFECRRWEGEIQNKEPHKCEKLAFFSPDNLPDNTVDYVADALKAISQGKIYSESGWPTNCLSV